MLDNLHLRLFKTQRLIIGLGWNTRNVQSSFWRFYHNDREGASLELPAGPYPLHADRLYFIPAGVRFSCRNTRELDHFYVHFDVIGLPSIATRELFSGPICLPRAAALEGATRQIAQELAEGEPVELSRQCRIKAVLYEGLAGYLESVPPDQMERCWQRAAALEPVLPAIRHIDADVSAPLSNRELAEQCHVSEDYFIRRFRECVGQTPAQYIRERRVTLAAQRLLFTDQSIEQIADETGFGSRFYFSRVFARHTGVSPAAYRKASRV
jgi:AraC-like DNA-binding protein